MTPPHEELAARVREDIDRNGDLIRKRDEHGAAQDTPNLRPGSWKKVEPQGAATYTVAGWKTNGETDAGIRHSCKNPLAAAAAVRSLLDAGCYQIVVESSQRPEPRL